MNLLLWRHAEAEDCADPGLDAQRKLTPRGEKQARRMAGWLDRQLPESARIWVSPTVRTEQTALALGRPFKICPELAPQVDIACLIDAVQWPRSKGHLLLIGHQPALGQLIAEILGVSTEVCSVRKGALWWLRCRQRGAVMQTLLVTVQSPDLH